ncbi:MAG: serine protease [Candidatus Eremiobacteraeota bacterium]|nr:serine protease [Candidatus Eremiobacteraeota bacterium]
MQNPENHFHFGDIHMKDGGSFNIAGGNIVDNKNITSSRVCEYEGSVIADQAKIDARSLMDSTVKIYMNAGKDEEGKDTYISKTGFFVSERGHILTCYHTGKEDLHKKKSEVIVKVIQNKKIYIYKSEQIEYLEGDQNLDYAILKLDTTKNILPLGCKPVKAGQDWKDSKNYYSFCYVSSDKLLGTSITGIIAGITKVGKNSSIYDCITMEGKAFLPGMSGSPVMNMKTDKVIGLISMGFTKRYFKSDKDGYHTRALAVQIEEIHKKSKLFRDIAKI